MDESHRHDVERKKLGTEEYNILLFGCCFETMVKDQLNLSGSHGEIATYKQNTEKKKKNLSILQNLRNPMLLGEKS